MLFNFLSLGWMSYFFIFCYLTDDLAFLILPLFNDFIFAFHVTTLVKLTLNQCWLTFRYSTKVSVYPHRQIIDFSSSVPFWNSLSETRVGVVNWHLRFDRMEAKVDPNFCREVICSTLRHRSHCFWLVFINIKLSL